MRLYRHNHAPNRVRRIISCWTSVGVTAVLLVGIIVIFSWRRLGLDLADEVAVDRSASPRHLGKGGSSSGMEITDPFIDKPYHESDQRYLVFIHVIIISYMLLGLNTVCDLYFTGALDEMVMKWDIKPDVAGATFMAAGGSAPELFTSLIGAVISESDVGFGTIVGSAVFNVLFVIGLCGSAAKVPIKLTWWPLARDCTYYIFGLSVLALFAKTGGEITILEAIVLFFGYIGYCTLMYYNPSLEARFVKKERSSGASPAISSASCGSSGEDAVTEMTPVTPVADTGSTADKHHIKKSQPHFERRSAGAHSQPSAGRTHSGGQMEKGHSKEHIIDLVEEDHPGDASPSTGGQTGEEIEDVEMDHVVSANSMQTQDSDEEDDIEELLLRPEGTLPFVLWCLSLPIYSILYYGIPKPTERMFLMTFGLSLVWIAVFSYVLVYCVEVLGGVLLGGVIDNYIIVMGFTLLAAGTSIPDLVSSMAVARAGEGDMAVSSSIGSNIFDILVGLPIPWIIKIGFVEMLGKGNTDFAVRIKSFYIVFYVLILVMMILCVIVSIHLLGWYLNRTLGLGMAVLYATFLVIVLSVEFSEPEGLKF